MQKLITPALMSAILNNVDFIDAEAINSVGLGTHQILSTFRLKIHLGSP